MNYDKWNRHYLDLVDHVAEWSEDRSTKIGAVLVKNNRVVAVGYNGMPTGVNDDLNERHERPTKYYYFEHAERNVIYTAARNGIVTEGATLYTTGVPCADCARGVIQAGISDIVVWKKGSGLEGTNRWADSIQAGETMLHEADVAIWEVEKSVTPILDVQGNQMYE
jgi:dCMP deaminase